MKKNEIGIPYGYLISEVSLLEEFDVTRIFKENQDCVLYDGHTFSGKVVYKKNWNTWDSRGKSLFNEVKL